MKRVFRLVTTLFVLGLLVSCDESSKLRVDRVEPATGISGGGDRVNIIGSGFQPGKTQARITFGTHICDQVVISSSNKIMVVTPAGDKGPVDVTLDFDNGSRFKIPGGFRYMEAKQTGDVRQAFFGKSGEKK
jgi:large repetitive protein